MNEQDFELLSQYLDGELDTFSARRLEQRLASEPALARSLEQMREQNASLKAAFEGQDTVPAAAIGLLKSRENVVALPSRPAQRPAWHYAVAASLVAGLGLMLAPPWQSNEAQPTLAQVLESTPSMAEGWTGLANGDRVRPILSFRNTDGNWCREYIGTRDDASYRGVACREDAQWQVQVAAADSAPAGADSFRPAGAGDVDDIARFIEQNAEGIALSADDEAALIARSWQ